jgi:hypothetical protein
MNLVVRMLLLFVVKEAAAVRPLSRVESKEENRIVTKVNLLRIKKMR